MLYIFIIVIGFTFIGGIVKYVRTRELRSKLGRDVGTHELVSLSSWIEAERKAEQNNKTAV